MLLSLGGVVEEYTEGPITIPSLTPGPALSWGNNLLGQLGTGNVITGTSPVTVVGGFTDWIYIEAGFQHSLAVRDNGTAWAWGSNGNGRLGDNTTIVRSSPVSIVGGFTDWTQVSAGFQHGLGLRSNGTAWSWGLNSNGQLGDNTTVTKSSPVSIVGGFTDWIQVSAGSTHNLGLRENGTAWAWGSNFAGKLGNNSTIQRSSPVLVAGGFTDWTQVSGGSRSSGGVRSDGTAWAWGDGGYGNLGNNLPGNVSSPVLVVGGFTDWVQVSVGDRHMLGLRANGTAWAWGFGSQGRLGDNTTVNKSSPVSVVGGFTDWIRVSGSSNHSSAVRLDGTAWTWGVNSSGQLGDNTTVNKSSPVSIVGGYTDWTQVSAGGYHSLGVR
jgi:alpha-tubulin suppressor-like RCC1 family protein